MNLLLVEANIFRDILLRNNNKIFVIYYLLAIFDYILFQIINSKNPYYNC